MAGDENLQARLGNIEDDVHELRTDVKDFRKEVEDDFKAMREDVEENTRAFREYRSLVGGILLAFTLVGAFLKFVWEYVKDHVAFK